MNVATKRTTRIEPAVSEYLSPKAPPRIAHCAGGSGTTPQRPTMNAVVYKEEGIIHSPDRTAIAAKTIIVHKRRRKQVTALEARRAFTAVESDDDDLEAQIGTILSFPRVFGREYWTVMRGTSLGPALWRDALETFVREMREKNGALRNEPVPVYAENSLAQFLQRAGA
jgi:hypothetical protein